MRFRFIVLALAALAASPFASSVPTPGANDAGSGSDAGDVPLLALAVPAGSFEGSVQAGLDGADVYSFEAPASAVVRARISAGGPVVAALADASGLVRARGTGASLDLAGIAVDAGAWTLTIAPAGFPVALAPTAYAVRLRYEAREHAERVDAPAALAQAFTVALPAGRFARAELAFATTETPLVEAPFASIGAAALCTAPGVGAGAEELHATSGAARASLLFHGDAPLPAEVTVTAPALREGEAVALAAVESGSADARWRVGLAASAPFATSLFLAWDGARPESAFLDGSASAMLPASSFEGEGASLTLASWSLVEDASASLAVPPRSTAVVAVDATNGVGATEPTRMALTEPGGRVREVVAQPLVLWSESVAAGEYVAGIEHLDGVDGGRYRLIGASFPFAPRCGA